MAVVTGNPATCNLFLARKRELLSGYYESTKKFAGFVNWIKYINY